jgi:signal transduction histidine kinase
VDLSLDPAASDPILLTDREWLRQVVESLIDNALRHATGLTRVVVALAAEGAHVVVTITDDGPGFPDLGDGLFERFRRDSPTGEAGFGIGLALARWVVERHDGTIRLGAGPGGRGAQVALDLPALSPSDAEHSPSPHPTGAQETVA